MIVIIENEEILILTIRVNKMFEPRKDDLPSGDHFNEGDFLTECEVLHIALDQCRNKDPFIGPIGVRKSIITDGPIDKEALVIFLQ